MKAAPEASVSVRGNARYRRILRFASKNLAETWWFDLFLPRIGLSGIADRTRAKRMTRFAKRFRVLALDLGGLMIKVGQFMSSRLDVLPEEITQELSELQDEVPAVPFEQIRSAAEQELGLPLERAFAWFDVEPVAAASLGQAHRARLTATEALDSGLGEVIVKVQRPGIDDLVAIDLAALRKVGGWLRKVRAVAERVDTRALIEEFAQTSLEEVDYLHEAANAERFAEDFAGDIRVGVPAVVWERTTRHVLTLQDVTAIKISDTQALRTAGIDPSEVASVFAAVMFDQVFKNGYFHADPHPGNIFVTPGEDGAWRLTFIDFGMMGEIAPDLRDNLRSVLIAAAMRDGVGMVAAIERMGMLLPGADKREVERAVMAVFDRFGGMGFAELKNVDIAEFEDFAEEFRELVREMPFQMPEQFLLIVRALSLVSGVCSTLDEKFNVWNAVEPYAATLLKEQGQGVLKDVASAAWAGAKALAQLPTGIDAVVERINAGELEVRLPRLEKQMGRIERAATRAGGALIFTATMVAGAIVRSDDATLGNVLLLASILPLGFTLFGGRSGR